MTWLHTRLGTTTRDGEAPRAYMVALRHVALSLDADPAWAVWWSASGVPACELGIVAEDRLDHLRPTADIRRAADLIRANFTSAPPPSPTDLVAQAAAELTGMFEVIREALGLPALPPLPPVPALPEEFPAVEVTTRALPSSPRDPDRQQGYLTLAQIHEFFG